MASCGRVSEVAKLWWQPQGCQSHCSKSFIAGSEESVMSSLTMPRNDENRGARYSKLSSLLVFLPRAHHEVASKLESLPLHLPRRN
jgi:hypothetical protein